MQDEKFHILSTRFLDEATTAKAIDANITIEAISFIDVQPIDSPNVKTTIQLASNESICAIFTSANAVNAVALHLKASPDWKIFCTGGKTKEFVTNIFGEEAIIASSKNASLLAERIIASNRIQKITFFCGDQHLTDLPDKLLAAGILTDKIIVYTTVPTPVFIEKNYDGILFFSPSAVHSFFSTNTIPVQVVLFSIGSTTTAAIQSYCTNKIITSEWPGTDSLLTLVTNFFHTASQGVD